MENDSTPPPVSEIDLATHKSRLIAPWWHTLLLILIMLGASAGQANHLSAAVAKSGRVPLYLGTIFMEWVLVGYIWIAIRRRGLALRDLVGGKWKTAEDALIDLAIGIGFWLVSISLLALVRILVGELSFRAADRAKQMQQAKQTLGFLAPHGGMEILLFVLLTITAGICEEIIFRGYFFQQFQLLSGSAAVGLLVQSILFGAAHGYQGWRLMITLVVDGALFGLLALWRKSLRPGMFAHAWQDLASGLILRALTSAK